MAIFEWLRGKISSGGSQAAASTAVPIQKVAVTEAMSRVLSESKRRLNEAEWQELLESFRIICNSRFAPDEVSLILVRVRPKVRKECERFLAMVAHGKGH